jgi:tryptophan synthase alpha chain
LRLVRTFRQTSQIPIVLFGYFNPFFCYGLKEFCRAAVRVGVDGILCVDLPPEESAELKYWTDLEGLDLIFLLSPTSGPHRVKLVAKKGRGFIYCVSVTGVTGARSALDADLRAQVARVRRATSLPIGVGFGISTPKQAAWIASFADAAVVGSALVERIEKAKGSAEKARSAGAFVSEIKRAIKQVAKKKKS